MASVYSTMVMFELIWKWAREFAGVHCWYIEGWGCGPARRKKKGLLPDKVLQCGFIELLNQVQGI